MSPEPHSVVAETDGCAVGPSFLGGCKPQPHWIAASYPSPLVPARPSFDDPGAGGARNDPITVRCGSTCTGMSASSWRAISVAIDAGEESRIIRPGPSSKSAVRYRLIIHNSGNPAASGMSPAWASSRQGQAQAGGYVNGATRACGLVAISGPSLSNQHTKTVQRDNGSSVKHRAVYIIRISCRCFSDFRHGTLYEIRDEKNTYARRIYDCELAFTPPC